MWPQQKCTGQIWIRPVEYLSAEVSGPSEVLWFAGKLIYLRTLDNITFSVYQRWFSAYASIFCFIPKILNCKLALRS